MSFLTTSRLSLIVFVLIFLFGASLFVFAEEEEKGKEKSIVSLGYLYSNWSAEKLKIEDDIDFDTRYGTATFDFEYSATDKFGFGVSGRISQIDQDWKGIDQSQKDYLMNNLVIAIGGGQYAAWEGSGDEIYQFDSNTSKYMSYINQYLDDYENTTTRNSGEIFVRYKLHDYLKLYLGAYYLRYDYYSFFEYTGWKDIVSRMGDSNFFARNIGYYERQNGFSGPRLALRGTIPIGEHTGFYGDAKIAYAQLWRMRATFPLKSKLFSENPKYAGKRILPFERPVDYLVKYEIERPGNKQAYQIDGAIGFIYKFESLHPKLPIVVSAYYEYCRIFLFDYTATEYVKDLVFGDNPKETMHNFVFNIGYEW
ncbi:hypothetical protein KKB18_09660 [bacterium]|nr:hypothetical protein [bacterium]